MKKRILLDAPIDKLYDTLISPTIEAYTNSKKKAPEEEALKHGLTFQVVVPNSRPTKYASIKILKYDKPHIFSMEYTSPTFHKIETIWLKENENHKVELIVEHIEERIQNGKVIKEKGKEYKDKVVPMSLFERGKYVRLASAVKKGLL